MAYEDFDTYTEVDPNSKITVTTNKVNCVGVRRDTSTYVHKDYGIGFFAGDLTIKFEMEVTNSVGNGTFAGAVCLSNAVGDWDATTGASDIMAVTWSTSPDVLPRIYEGGVQVLSLTVSEPNEDTLYFVEMTRDDDAGDTSQGLWTVTVRTGSHTGSVVNTDSGSVDTKIGYQYVIVAQMQDSNTGNVDGYIQNLEITVEGEEEEGGETTLDLLMGKTFAQIDLFVGVPIGNLAAIMGKSTSGATPYKDFTVYTEVDSGEDIDIIPATITITSMRKDENSYVFGDYGADFLTGDFTQRIKSDFTGGTETGAISSIVIGYHNDPGRTAQDFLDASDGNFIQARWDGDNYTFQIYDANTDDNYHHNLGATPPGPRWIEIDRTGTRLTAKFYTDAYDTFEASISCSAETTAWRYISHAGSREVGGAETITYTVEDFQTIIPDGDPIPSPYEDFTTYTEADAGNDITIPFNYKVAIDTMRRDAGPGVYLRKDYGASTFGDFIHRFKTTVTQAGSTEAGEWMCYAMSNTYDNLANMYDNNDGLGLTWHFAGSGNLRIILWDCENQVSDFKQYGAWFTRYIEIERSGTTLTAKIYTNSDYSGLEDTLTVTCGTTSYSTVYACAARNSNTTADAVIVGSTENIEFNISPPSVKDFTAYTEVDSGGDIERADSQITVDTMQKVAVSYVAEDYGVDYFGNFTHRMKINWTAASADGALGIFWGISDTNYTLQDLDVANEGMALFVNRKPTEDYTMVLRDFTNDNEDLFSFGSSAPGIRYIEVERNGTTLTAKIYTDEFETLEDTLTITCTNTSYDSHIAISSRDIAGSQTVSFTLNDLYFIS